MIKSFSSKLENLQIRVTEREQAANEIVEKVFSVEISFKDLETKFDSVKEEVNEQMKESCQLMAGLLAEIEEN